MSLRLRMGPFSVSSRGRVGVSAGPVSWSGGGVRGGGGSGLLGSFLGFCLVLAILLLVVLWPLSLWGHALHMTPSWHQLMHRDKAWLHEHYPLVGLRYAVALALLLIVATAALAPVVRQQLRLADERAAERERQRAEAYRSWLDSPPEPLRLPARFTQTWLEENVPLLHPGQVPMLMDEMRARGWTDAGFNSASPHTSSATADVLRA